MATMSRKWTIALTLGIFVILAVWGSAAIVQAFVLVEVEPNDSISTAQDVDGSFSLDFDANIGDESGANTSTSIPNVTVVATGNGTFDYYSFTVCRSGVLGIFDIDLGFGVGGSIDTELFLYDLAGNIKAANDDFSIAAGASGSSSGLDAFIQHTFASPGTYVIGVGEDPSFDDRRFPDTPITGNEPDVGDTYTLQISIDCALPAVAVGGATSFLTGGSNSSLGSIALLAGGVAAIVAIAAGGWFARRRRTTDRA